MIEFKQRIWNREDQYISVFHTTTKDTVVAICHPSDPEKIAPKESDKWLDIKLSHEEVGELLDILQKEWKRHLGEK